MANFHSYVSHYKRVCAHTNGSTSKLRLPLGFRMPWVYSMTGFALRICSRMERYSTVPTAAAANIGVKTSWSQQVAHSPNLL